MATSSYQIQNSRFKTKCGVYKITNTVNNTFYIGSTSSSFYKRHYGHFYSLSKNSHANNKLQRAYNKYGKESFKFEILSICPSEYVLKMEQWFLDNLNPELNILKIAGSAKGFIMSEEAKNKISIANKGKKKPPRSLEVIRRIAESNRGKIVSQKTRDLLSSHRKGKPLSEEHKQRLVEGHKKRDKKTYANFIACSKNRTKEERTLIGKLGASLVKNRPMSKIILDLQTGIFYDSISECAKAFDHKISTFKECLRLGRNSRTLNITKRFIKI